MYKKVQPTEFGYGHIRDEYIIAYKGEFDYPGNSLNGTITIDTYYDDMTGLTLYKYFDQLCTMKELRREYLKDYYKVD